MVYFVQSPATGLVKIGFTDDVQQRYRCLCSSMNETFCPLGEIVGGRTVEAQLHSMFADYQVFGEWFLACDALKDMVGRHCREMKTPSVPTARSTVPDLVYYWPVHSARIRKIRDGGAPAFKVMPMWKRERDPDPLPLPCCPMLQPAGSSVAPLDPSARSPHPRTWIK